MLCQLLALCLKCYRPEAWTGFQSFFERQCSNSEKNNDQTAPLIATRVSTKIMDDCFENFVGLVSTRKIGPAGPL